MGYIEDEVQSAYINDRNILDRPLVMNKLCTWAKKSKTQMFLFKVDFEKALDTMNQGYLDSVMEQMAFRSKSRNWNRDCLSNSKASVLVNGTPTYEFLISREVRQKDPLSPFLFIFAMEGLHMVIKGACNKSLIQGFKLPH